MAHLFLVVQLSLYRDRNRNKYLYGHSCARNEEDRNWGRRNRRGAVDQASWVSQKWPKMDSGAPCLEKDWIKPKRLDRGGLVLNGWSNQIQGRRAAVGWLTAGGQCANLRYTLIFLIYSASHITTRRSRTRLIMDFDLPIFRNAIQCVRGNAAGNGWAG